MTTTYPFGYSQGVRLSQADLDQRAQWVMIHPEFRRRILAMLDRAQADGVYLGVGGGGRTTAQQERLFLDRHHECSTPGCTHYNGLCWCLDAGVAAAAPPGGSYHEPTTPDGFALAADMIGNMAWMHAHDGEFGIVDATTWSTHEPWHIQPVEVPQARHDYNPARHQLAVFTLPGTVPPAPGPDPGPTVYPPMPYQPGSLARGATGRDVYLLQVALRWVAGQTFVAPDGQFGKMTETGVANVQHYMGLTVTGVVDGATWAALHFAAQGTPKPSA